MKGTEPMNNDEPMTVPEEALQSGREIGRAVSEAAAPDDAPAAPETFNTPQAQPEAPHPEDLQPETEAPQQEDADTQLHSWQREAEDLQKIYPGFDLQRECALPTGARFASLLQAGVDVRTAFEVIHRDEILGTAMRMTAERIRKQTLTGLQARSDRPTEGGTGHGGGFPEGPARFTRAEREEISRRVLRGERIRF